MALEDETQVIPFLPTENEARRTRDKIRFDRSRPAFIKITASYPHNAESDFDADPRVAAAEVQRRKGPPRMVYPPPGSTRKSVNNVNETSKKRAETHGGVSLRGGGDDEEGSDDERKGRGKSESGTSMEAACLLNPNDNDGTTANHDAAVALENDFLWPEDEHKLEEDEFPREFDYMFNVSNYLDAFDEARRITQQWANEKRLDPKRVPQIKKPLRSAVRKAIKANNAWLESWHDQLVRGATSDCSKDWLLE